MKQYNCKNCGAVLYWNPNSSCLECEYCLTKYNISDFEQEEQIAEENAKSEIEQKFVPEQADENMQATDESENNDLVVYKCSNCNAEVVTSKTTIATTCAFCGEALSITNKIVNDFKPDYVVPFKITKEQAIELYKEYTKKGILTPKDFRSENVVEKTKGMYIPFWLHSFTDKVHAVVHGENVSSHKRGYDKVNVHDMYEFDIDAVGSFENIPADALKYVDNKLMDSIEPFDYSNLESFSPAYMAGYYAEEYGESASQTSERATKRADEAMSNQIIKYVTKCSNKKITSSNSNADSLTSKYTMLPVWLFHTKYKGENYVYAVNGQTGKVAGDLPISSKALAKYGVIAFAATQVIALLLRIIGAMGV